MIYVLHGQDTSSSYARLQEILASYKSYQILNLSSNSTPEEFTLAIFSQNIAGAQEVIVCENFLFKKRIKIEQLKIIPHEKVVIFWEQGQLTESIIEKVSNLAKIENFKPPSQIFRFLDSLSPSVKKSLSFIEALEKTDNYSLIWLFENRILLMILAKLGLGKNTAGKITNNKIAPWQWSKIINQSSQFDLQVLLKLFNGVLKVENLIKTGRTNLKVTTLVSALLLKYLDPISKLSFGA